MDFRTRLGLTPLARVRMALDRSLSVDMASLMARLAETDNEDGVDEDDER
jgi:hypothetical protein